MVFGLERTRAFYAEDSNVKGSTLHIPSQPNGEVEKAVKIVLRDAKAPSSSTKFGYITTIEVSDPSKIKDALTKHAAEKTEESEINPVDIGMALSFPLALAGMAAVLLAANLIAPFLATASFLVVMLVVLAFSVALIAVPTVIFSIFAAIACGVAFTNQDTRAAEKQHQADFFKKVKELSTKELSNELKLQKTIDTMNANNGVEDSGPSVIEMTI